MHYQHLSQEERDRLALMRGQGYSLRAIAQRIGRSFSSLSRELKRNQGAYGYYPHSAQKKAQQRLQLSHQSVHLKSFELRQAVWRLLEKRWSPELISGRLKRVRPDLPAISPEAIYQWIYRDRRDLIPYLSRAHRKRLPRKSRLTHRVRIPDRIPVSRRPLAAQDRSEAGHWETDQIVGPGTGALQVLVERQTRFTRLCRIFQKSAASSRAALTGLLDKVPDPLRRSITYDNGPENTEHQVLNEDFGMRSYFCEPYHSWEKGTVENTNGLIRRFIPKATPMATLPDTLIVQLEDWLNDRPRKVLNYQTPREAFMKLCCTY